MNQLRISALRCWKQLLGGVVLMVISAAGIASAAGSPQAPPEATFDSFYGTIAIHGCQVAADELLVRARPIVPPSNPGAPEISKQRYPSRVVKARHTSPGNFDFLIEGMTTQIPYRLGVKLLGESRSRCGKIVWNVSRDPLVLPGEAGLAFDGYTVHSRLEVWGAAGPNRAAPTWVSSDALNFDNPEAAVRKFRWRSLDPEVTGGQLQVSTAPFPHAGDRAFNPCSVDDSRIIYRGDFRAAPGEWAAVEVDFNAIVHGRIGPSGPAEGDAVIGPGPGPAAIDENMLTRLNLGHPLYVRVMPVINGEIICDPDRGVPAESVLAKIIQEVADILDDPVFTVDKITYTPPFVGARPYAGETCYRITKDHQVLPYMSGGGAWDQLTEIHMSGVDYWDWVHEGKWQSFCVSNDSGDDGWFESFVNGFGAVLTGLVDAIGDLVNSASAMWEKIQDYAVQAVASGLEVIPGVSCPPKPCQAALEMGLEVGLATMGVPPSLPNFDELVDQGVDYLAAQAASQLGVPSELTDYASDEAQKFIKKAAKNMQDRPFSMPGLPDWLVPYLRFDPAYLTLEIHGRGIPLTYRPGIIRDNDPIYAGRFVQLPSKLPAPWEKPLLYPMVLEPNTAGLPELPASKCSSSQWKAIATLGGESMAHALCDYTEYEAAVWQKNQWVTQRYNAGCYHLRMIGLSDGFEFFLLADQTFDPTSDLITIPCLTGAVIQP